MAETYEELSTGFSTADTLGSIRICLNSDVLNVDFESSDGKRRRVIFSDVRAFAWNGWEGTSADISPDRIYQVGGSTFLAPWESFSVDGKRFVHYKLGFNAEGKYLDIIATSMSEVESSPSE